MVIAPITPNDPQSRAKMNQAIAEANRLGVDLAAETEARGTADAALAPKQDLAGTQAGPGEAPSFWTADLDDPAGAPDPLTDQARVVGSDGAVIRVSGAAVVANRGYVRIEPGRLYKARYVVRRRTNSPDPSDDGVRCAIRWYGQAKEPLSGGVSVVEDLLDLKVADGRVSVAAVASRMAGSQVTVVAPAGARYGKGYVQTYGIGGVTDVEIIELVDITDSSLFAPDVEDFDARLMAVESLDIGDRIGAIEAAIGNPNTFTLETVGDLEAATIPASVQTVVLLWGDTQGDGLGGQYDRTAPSGDHQSADGAWWTRVNPNLLLATQSQAVGRADNIRGMTSLRVWQSIEANAQDAAFEHDADDTVARTIRAKLSDTLSLLDFDVPTDGVTDAAPFFALAPAGRVIDVPAGDYVLNSDVTSSAIFRFAAGVRILNKSLYARVETPALTYPSRRKSLGEVITKLKAGEPTVWYFFGSSIFYGADSGGALPGIPDPGTGLGDGGPRALPPIPTAFLNSMLATYGVSAPITVLNKSFPGGTTKKTLDDYPVLTDGAPDVEIYGLMTNDANPVSAISIADYRRNLGALVERAIARGAVVILTLDPMPPNPPSAQQIRPYAEACRQVAQEYGVLLYDCNEQFLHLSDRWSADFFHPNARGYNEIGSHLAALFISYDGDTIPRVAAGRKFFPEDNAWIGGSFFVSGLGPHGYLGTLAANAVLSMGVYCEEDVYPVIETYSSGAARSLSWLYTGSPGNAVPLIPIHNPASGSPRRRNFGPLLRRGYRALRVVNGASDALISSIEFVSAANAPIESGVWRSSQLGGQHTPAEGVAAPYAVVDRSLRVRGAWFDAKLTLSQSPTACGILIAKEDTGYALDRPASCLFIGREGTSLIVDQYINGTATRLLGLPAIFPAGEFIGHIGAQYTGVAGGDGSLVVVVDGNLGGGTYTSSPIATNADLGVWVHPGLMTLKAAAADRGFACSSFLVSER